jgi:NAD(P)H dehydrogenase (quinone)
MQVLVLFHSTYGHVYHLALAIAEGARDVPGVDVVVKRVPETLALLATEAQLAFAEVPTASVEDLEVADGILFGSPTRFGSMAGQMRQFLDTTGGLWNQGKLVGKLGSVFTGWATEPGGQEATLLSSHATLLHHGMVIVGLPYTFEGQTRLEGVRGGSPHRSSTIFDASNERRVCDNELVGARFQGRHMAQLVMQRSAMQRSAMQRSA